MLGDQGGSSSGTVFRVTLLAALVFVLFALAAGQSVFAHHTASISTDAKSYAPGNLATIYGSSFAPSSSVTVAVTEPDGSVTTWTVGSDNTGAFTTTYQLDSLSGTYYVTATDDSENTATTAFADPTCNPGPHDCTLYLSVYSGPVGTTITLLQSSGGFDPGQVYGYCFATDPVSNKCLTLPGSFTAASDGTIPAGVDVTVPGGATGTEYVVVCDKTDCLGEIPADAPFTVTSGETGATTTVTTTATSTVTSTQISTVTSIVTSTQLSTLTSTQTSLTTSVSSATQTSTVTSTQLATTTSTQTSTVTSVSSATRTTTETSTVTTTLTSYVPVTTTVTLSTTTTLPGTTATSTVTSTATTTVTTVSPSTSTSTYVTTLTEPGTTETSTVTSVSASTLTSYIFVPTTTTYETTENGPETTVTSTVTSEGTSVATSYATTTATTTYLTTIAAQGAATTFTTTTEMVSTVSSYITTTSVSTYTTTVTGRGTTITSVVASTVTSSVRSLSTVTTVTTITTPSFPPTSLSPISVLCDHALTTVGVRVKCEAEIEAKVVAPVTLSPTGIIAWSSGSAGKFSSVSCKLLKHIAYSACTVSFTPMAAGHPVFLTVSYGGDQNNPPSVGAYNLTVAQMTPKITISCSPKTAAAGSPTQITCRARVIGFSPTGTVTWAQSGSGTVIFNAQTCTLSRGGCSITMRTTSSGSVAIQVTYKGDSNNLPVSSTLNLTIK